MEGLVLGGRTVGLGRAACHAQSQDRGPIASQGEVDLLVYRPREQAVQLRVRKGTDLATLHEQDFIPTTHPCLVRGQMRRYVADEGAPRLLAGQNRSNGARTRSTSGEQDRAHAKDGAEASGALGHVTSDTPR